MMATTQQLQVAVLAWLLTRHPAQALLGALVSDTATVVDVSGSEKPSSQVQTRLAPDHDPEGVLEVNATVVVVLVLAAAPWRCRCRCLRQFADPAAFAPCV